MERQIGVFIADASRDFLLLLKSALERQPGLTVVDGAYNGLEAYGKLSQAQPDVLVTDLLLPGIDGLSLLQRLKREGTMPRTIVVSSFINDRIAQAVCRLGVDDYLIKPCGMAELVARIRDARSPGPRWRAEDLEPMIREALMAYGVPSHLSGYRYLQSAVRRTMEDRSVLRGITKILYPDVAREYNTTAHCVERSIRSAVLKGWESGQPEKRRRYFGPLFEEQETAPSNARFISDLVEFLQMGYVYR